MLVGDSYGALEFLKPVYDDRYETSPEAHARDRAGVSVFWVKPDQNFPFGSKFSIMTNITKLQLAAAF